MGYRRLRETERWLAWIRLAALPFALVQVGLGRSYPQGYERWAWLATGLLVGGALVLFPLSRRDLTGRGQVVLGVAATSFDFAIVSAYILVYSFEPGSPIRQIIFLPLVEAALRWGIPGALGLSLASTPVLVLFESLRSRHAHQRYHLDYVTVQVGVEVLLGLIVGWLVLRLLRQTGIAETRAADAEELRDELGRRADVLEAATRCARALSSSLDLEEAFGAFIRELRGLVPFDRTAIVLVDQGAAQVMAVAGVGAEEIFRPGTRRPVAGSLLDELLRRGQAIYRPDMTETRYPEEHELSQVGLRSRLAAPLLQGPHSIGMLSLVRREPDAFSVQEIELVSLLGRLVGSAVQNIRAYEAERKTVEELRRLSALRADFVSLVSHELRTPMASVIGSARTLQQRWRELDAAQRESFLSLIANETSRLASLIGDVLDTSRIEAGTFSYTFADLDLEELVRESVANAEVAQDEVRVRAAIDERPPAVRGDRDRLRQVLANLIDNAIKYSPAGEEVEVRAYHVDSELRLEVSDHGPGIPKDRQKLIFERFGRANVGDGKPGTGLGLFIARSIAEAHGGTLEVASGPERGATFTLVLPLSG